MKIGCCGSFKERELLKDIGFDFIESPVGELVPFSSIDNFLAKIDNFGENSLPFYAFNCFVPGDLKICGPEVDFMRLERYVKNVFERITKLGGKIVVFGSGSARNIPDNFSTDTARSQLKDFMLMVSKHLQNYDIELVIEPLRSEESNVLNTLSESLDIFNDMNRPQKIRLLVDLYHMEEEEEPYENIMEAGDFLSHIHVADTERFYPGSGDYNYDYFFELLSDINYKGNISIECKWTNKKEEARKALYFLREMTNKYSL